jgi:hypothetical protein
MFLEAVVIQVSHPRHPQEEEEGEEEEEEAAGEEEGGAGAGAGQELGEELQIAELLEELAQVQDEDEFAAGARESFKMRDVVEITEEPDAGAVTVGGAASQEV